MKAVFAKTPCQIEVREIERPQLQEPDDVLVKVKACGICGWDYIQVSKTLENFERLGHEFAGEVAETGRGCTRVKPGDQVIVRPLRPCGLCEACENVQPTLCSAPLTATSFGMSEYVCEKEALLEPFEGIRFEEAAVTEPITAALDMVEVADIPLGGSVCVVGGGFIGLAALRLARLRGAGRVFLSELSQRKARIDAAMELGADEVVLADQEDLVERMKALCPGGVDRVLLTGPSRLITEAFQFLRVGGIVCPMGVDVGDAKLVTFDINDFHFRRLQIRGSVNPTVRFSLAVQLLRDKALDGGVLISHTYDLSNAEAAFQESFSHPEDKVKVVITMA